MEKYDSIIIGAGLGGLTAGAKLSREGKKVLVIEQHDRPGGYATTFTRKEFTFEVGLHEMDGPVPGDMKTRIFNDLDVFGNVELIRLPEFYRFINGRADITIPHDPVVAAERLTALFPDEAGGIHAYFEKILGSPKKQAENNDHDTSIGDFLDSIIRHEDLKLILLGNLGYFHDDPYTLSLAYFTVSEGSYFRGDASFIKGGSQALSDHLAAFITKHGGTVLLNHLVTQIPVDDHKIKGVVYRRKSTRETKQFQVLADEVIANNAMPMVAEMLPEEYGNVLKNAIREQKTGASLLTIYLGLSKPLCELGYHHYSTAVFDESVLTQRDVLKNNRDDYIRRSFIFADYGQVDSGLAPAGKSVGGICCVDYPEDWEGLERKAYLNKKKEVSALYLNRLEKLIPGVKNIVEHVEVGTPLTLRRYTLNPGGAVYGFAQNPSRKAIDLTGLPDNLHFASAWGKTGGGFSGAIYGGYLTALNVLRKRRG